MDRGTRLYFSSVFLITEGFQFSSKNVYVLFICLGLYLNCIQWGRFFFFFTFERNGRGGKITQMPFFIIVLVFNLKGEGFSDNAWRLDVEVQYGGSEIL